MPDLWPASMTPFPPSLQPTQPELPPYNNPLLQEGRAFWGTKTSRNVAGT